MLDWTTGNKHKNAACGNLLLVSISNLHFGESKPFKRILEMTHEFHNPNTSSLLSHWLIEFWHRNRNSLIFCFSSDFRLSLFGQTNCPLMLRAFKWGDGCLLCHLYNLFKIVVLMFFRPGEPPPNVPQESSRFYFTKTLKSSGPLNTSMCMSQN